MPKINFISAQGDTQVVEARVGDSLMQAAKAGNIHAIDAECGGACACATCHVYLAPEWFDRLGPLTESEEMMLEFAQSVAETSRLSCQIKVTDDMDGLSVTLPDRTLSV
jgi:2Fe-2S ferredoxin